MILSFSVGGIGVCFGVYLVELRGFEFLVIGFAPITRPQSSEKCRISGLERITLSEVPELH
jgi:hypothetical protein